MLNFTGKKVWKTFLDFSTNILFSFILPVLWSAASPFVLSMLLIVECICKFLWLFKFVTFIFHLFIIQSLQD